MLGFADWLLEQKLLKDRHWSVWLVYTHQRSLKEGVSGNPGPSIG